MLIDLFWLSIEYLCFTALLFCALQLVRVIFLDRTHDLLATLDQHPMQEYSYVRLVRVTAACVSMALAFVVLYCLWSWRFTVTSSCLAVLKQILSASPPGGQTAELVTVIKRSVAAIQVRRALIRAQRHQH